jgi:hypothetical protein
MVPLVVIVVIMTGCDAVVAALIHAEWRSNFCGIRFVIIVELLPPALSRCVRPAAAAPRGSPVGCAACE